MRGLETDRNQYMVDALRRKWAKRICAPLLVILAVLIVLSLGEAIGQRSPDHQSSEVPQSAR
jgi:hypothetical protein